MQGLLTLVMLFSSFGLSATSVFAETQTLRQETRMAEAHLVGSKSGTNWITARPKFGWGVSYIGNTIAYCINPLIGANYNNSYNSSDLFDQLSPEVQEKLWNIGYFGYGYNSDKNPLRYMAAQELVWETVPIGSQNPWGGNDTWEIEWTGGMGEDVDRIHQYKQEIVDLMNSKYQKPSFDGKTFEGKVNEIITLNDSNGVLDRFSVKTGNGVEIVSQSNSELKLRIIRKAFADTVQFESKTQPSEASTFVWESGSYQKFFSIGRDRFELLTGQFKLVLSTGSLEITKTDQDDHPIAGVVFEVSRDRDMRQIIATVPTNASGIARLDDLDAGTVYYREKSVPAPLLIDQTIREIEIESREVRSATVINETAVGRLDLQKLDSETGTKPQGDGVLKDAEYTLYAAKEIMNHNGKITYYKEGNVVARRVTADDGSMDTIENLPLGDYVLKETKAPIGYQLDTGSYPISITYQNQTVPIVVVSKTLEDHVVKGTVGLVKVGTNGETGLVHPLVGAEFTFKLKSQVVEFGWDKVTPADVIVTNHRGEATTKELPYGVYIGCETKTPENHQTIEDFEVTIQEDQEQKHFIFNDAPYEAHLKIVKQDAETGKVIKLPNTTFKIKNLDTDTYVEQSLFYPLPFKTTEFKTNDQGELITQIKLQSGNYQIEEIRSSYGYVLRVVNPSSFH